MIRLPFRASLLGIGGLATASRRPPPWRSPKLVSLRTVRGGIPVARIAAPDFKP